MPPTRLVSPRCGPWCFRRAPANGFIGCCAALSDHNFRDAVGGRDAPGPVCRRRKGPAKARDARDERLAQLAGSQFVEIAGAGHICNIEQPDAFTHAVEQFLTT